MPLNILFICTGNLCRSPMAAAMFADHKPATLACTMASAGTLGIDGHPAHPLAIGLMRERNIDLSAHRARTITPDLLMNADLILTMEGEHREWIETRMPILQTRTHLLGHWRSLEITDPMNGGREAFERVATEIEDCLGDWSLYLQRQAANGATEKPATNTA